MVIRVLFVFVLLGGIALGQSLPDAPSIHCQNGDLPLTGVKAKLVGACPFDVPLNDHFAPPPEKRDPFLSWRRNLNGPLLKPTRKAWAIVIASNAASWVSYAQCNHKIEEPHSEIPALIAMSGLSWFTTKAFSPAFGAAVPVYGTIHYARVH